MYRIKAFVRVMLFLFLLIEIIFCSDALSITVPGLKLLYTFPLEDVSFYVRAGHQPDAFVKFSPNGKFLAIGTFLGRIFVLEAKTGKILWKKRVPEGMIKKIAFSPDSLTVYYGEQSPDGFVYAADVKTGKIKWRFRLANDLLIGEPPEKGDVYGIYREPGCYRLCIMPNGDILILGLHSWFNSKLNTWCRLSRIYRLSPEGKLIWAWPSDAPMKISMVYADVDAAGEKIVTVTLSPSDNLASNYPYTPGTFYLLNANTGREIWRYHVPPLKPYYNYVSIWESVRITPDGHYALIGTADGRAFILDLRNFRSKIIPLGSPIKIGGFPVASIISYAYATKDTLYFLTGSSSLPYAMSLAIDRPAGPHPQAQTLFALSLSGDEKWRFSAGFKLQGIAADKDGKILVIAAGGVFRNYSKISHQFGIFVFDTKRPGGGLKKLIGYFPTQGPCFFHLAVSPKGDMIAAVETPYITSDERLIGKYQVLVIKRVTENVRAF